MRSKSKQIHIIFRNKTSGEDEDVILRVILSVPKEYRDVRGAFFIFTITHKDEVMQEFRKRIRGSDIECEFSVHSEIAKRPSSLRIVIQA
jgi:hypothetical protein